MRAWDETDDLIRRATERRDADHEATLNELGAEGVDLDPAAPGNHRHGDVEHPSDHAHPHAHSAPGERPVVGIVGAGPVGTALGVALDRAGWPVGAVASRDPARRDRFRSLVPSARGFAEANALVDEVELVILAVPDDAIAQVAGSLRLYAGQALIHTSGALGADALGPALAAGTQAGSFSPLVAFADLDRALAALEGATIAIEADDDLAAHLADMAEAIGGVPVRLPPGAKAAYHAAAVLAAGGTVALLDTIRGPAVRVQERHRATRGRRGPRRGRRTSSRRKADGHGPDRLGHVREQRGQVVVALDGDRGAVQRGERPLGSANADERGERARLGSGGHRRRKTSAPSAPLVWTIAWPAYSGGTRRRGRRRRRDGEDDQLDLVHRAVASAKPGRPGRGRNRSAARGPASPPRRPASRPVERDAQRGPDRPRADDPDDRRLRAPVDVGVGVVARRGPRRRGGGGRAGPGRGRSRRLRSPRSSPRAPASRRSGSPAAPSSARPRPSSAGSPGAGGCAVLFHATSVAIAPREDARAQPPRITLPRTDAFGARASLGAGAARLLPARGRRSGPPGSTSAGPRSR